MTQGAAAAAGESVRARLSARLFAVVCVGYALFHIVTAAIGSFQPLVQRGIFIAFAVFLALWNLAQAPGRAVTVRLVYFLLAVAGFAGGLHAVINDARFMDVMNDLTRLDMLLATGLLLALVVATQRLLGWALPVLTVVGLVYYAYGNGLISGNWQPPRTSPDTLFGTLYASTNGIFGFMADIGTGVIAIYVIFGAVLMATGAGDVFVQLATRAAGRGHGGPAKVAVVTSALFGTVSGSAVANVMAVGTLTIPTMNRAGYPKAFAAGVEASASAGGQIMPPIMGAGAFLMAELLNIHYLTVATAALLPAILYFLAIFVSVDLYARKHNLGRDAAPPVRIEVGKAVPLAASVLALIVMLVRSYTPTMAGVTALAALLLTSGAFALLDGFRRDRLHVELVDFAWKIWRGLVEGGKGLIMIAVLLGCASILTTVLGASGLGAKFSSELLAVAGTQLLGALLLAAVLCILLGMDVPTTASYVLTASVAAPLLTKLGLPPLAAHMFIFYFAILSAITPPVCASVYAASAIAQERFWAVARYALTVAAAVYVIPFMFVYRPALLLPAPPAEVAYTLLITGLAVIAMCGAMIGYLAGPAGRWDRLLLFSAATLFFFPGAFYDAGAGVLLAAVLAMQLSRRRCRMSAHAASPTPQEKTQE